MQELDKSKIYGKHIGEVYGRLTVTGVLPYEEWSNFGNPPRPVVTAVCECGGQWAGKLNSLKTGNCKSCGCGHFYADHAGEVGKKYNRLTVTAILPRSEWIKVEGKSGKKEMCLPVVTAVCDCGSEWRGRLYAIQHGTTKSCGCINRDRLRAVNGANLKHGMCRSPEYNTYRAMLKRCYCESHVSYQDYGGRGITVCDEWRTSFETFFLDMGARPGPKFSIERINNALGYSRENCVWATCKEQNNNRRNNHAISYLGVDYPSITALSEAVGVNRSLIKDRLLRGWSVEAAVETPKKR